MLNKSFRITEDKYNDSSRGKCYRTEINWHLMMTSNTSPGAQNYINLTNQEVSLHLTTTSQPIISFMLSTLNFGWPWLRYHKFSRYICMVHVSSGNIALTDILLSHKLVNCMEQNNKLKINGWTTTTNNRSTIERWPRNLHYQHKWIEHPPLPFQLG